MRIQWTPVVLLSILITCWLTLAHAQIFQGDSAQTFTIDVGMDTGRLSDVEFLVSVSQIIEDDKDRLAYLKTDSITLEPIFQQKSERFFIVDGMLDSMRNRTPGSSEVLFLEYEWKYLKGVLDFLLDRRRSIQLQLRILTLKLRKEEEVLQFLMKGKMYTILEHTLRHDLAESSTQGAVDSATLVRDTLRTSNNIGQLNSNDFDWSVIKAERELIGLKARFEYAKETWLFVEGLLALNEDDLSLAQSLFKKATYQLTTLKANFALMEQIRSQLVEADSARDVQLLISQMQDQTKTILARIASTIAKDGPLQNDLERRITRLKNFQKPISDAVGQATKDIEKKDRWLKYLRSPMAPHSIQTFLVTSGPRILTIMLVLFLFWVLSRWMIKAILPRLRLTPYRSKEEREERIETLKRAFRSGLSIIFLVVGVLTLLSEFGIDVSVLLGGAAVFSLAIAFGAQSLIKDYFSGFMILTENQYRVGNVVKINNVSGVVEDVALRMTVLRDIEGTAHFIPHSEIRIVSNLSHGWSQVALEIKVSYKENVDTVIEVVMDVASVLQKDETFGKLILSEPEMLGVEEFADYGVTIKVLIKTLPQKQWAVRRELLRRIKNRFDELNIEIALPKVYYASVDDALVPFKDTKDEKKNKF